MRVSTNERSPAPIPDRVSLEAGLMSQDVYVTNVVKHFRYKLRGRRRIDQKPDRWQVSACPPWLRAEAQDGLASDLGEVRQWLSAR